MRILRLTWPAIFTLLFVASLFRRPALADAQPAPAATPTLNVELPPMPRGLPAETLDVEVLRALETWNPRVLEETLRPWANAIASAAPNRADAIWLASQASVETKFVAYVLDFKCNTEPGNYPMGDCDRGVAVGPWQMHDKKMLHASPVDQAERAIEWMRRRPRQWSTWRAARAQADAWLR